MDEQNKSDDTLHDDIQSEIDDKYEHIKGALLQDLHNKLGSEPSHLDQFNFLIHHIAILSVQVNDLQAFSQHLIRSQLDQELGPLEDDDSDDEIALFDMDVDVERMPVDQDDSRPVDVSL